VGNYLMQHPLVHLYLLYVVVMFVALIFASTRARSESAPESKPDRPELVRSADTGSSTVPVLASRKPEPPDSIAGDGAGI
jgi:hypothetical protein